MKKTKFNYSLDLYHSSTDPPKYFEGSIRLRYSTSTKARRIEHEYEMDATGGQPPKAARRPGL